MGIRYIIHGGKSLHGSITVKGSPLAAVGAMAASLLTTDKVTLTNVPHLFDLDVLIEELRGLGVVADWTHPHEMTLMAESVTQEPKILPNHLVGWSPVLLGALVLRSSRVTVTATEADLLDDRLSIVVSLVRRFGGSAEWYGDQLHLELHHVHGAEMVLDGISAEQTLLAVLLAVTANGDTILENVVLDPEIEDILVCLRSMGAIIEQPEAGRIQIMGQQRLHGATHKLVPDRYEAALLAVMAAHSQGDVLIKDIKPHTLMSFLAKLQQLGVSFKVGKEGIRFWSDGHRHYMPIRLSVKSYPGIGRDWLPLFLPLLCRADGESLIETDSPGELSGALRLIQGIGGEVHLHYGTARVFGPSKLVASKIDSDGFVTALTGLVVAMGCNGVSDIGGADGIDGRFEMLAERISQLGVKVERVEA